MTSAEYKYWAFISYSHQDNLSVRGDRSGDHIQWANWLHEQLETFQIPASYRDRATRTGDRMPERFFPTFRDEAELPTSHDLGGQIRDALEHSRFLIVIASPRSACSRYVNEEVRYFRQLGRSDRILTLIVDGEPNVRLHPKAGWSATDGCFCPALVHPLSPDDEEDTDRLLPEEPIAADVRAKDTEPPREMRASECDQPDRRALLEFMTLKLIAGLMGVGLDELVQRDKVRADEEERLRSRNLRRWLAAVGALALFALLAAGFAWVNKLEATQQAEVAKGARDKAVASRKAADELIEYMQYDLRSTLSKVGRLSLMVGIDERIAKYREEHPPEEGDFHAERELGTMILGQGDVLLAQGQLSKALEAYEKCRSIFASLTRVQPNDTDFQRDLASSYSRIANIHSALGQLTDALQAERESLAIAERLAKENPGNARGQRDLSVCHEKVGAVLRAKGQLSEALRACYDCLSIREQLSKTDPKNLLWQSDLAGTYRLVGDVHYDKGQHSEAHKAYLDFLTIAERLAEADPDNANWQQSLSVAYCKAGQFLLTRGQLSEALDACHDALAISERLANEDQDNADWQRDLSVLHSVVGEILSEQGNSDAAAKSFSNCLAIRERLVKNTPSNAVLQRDLAAINEKIGAGAFRQERWADAAAAFVREVEIARPWLERSDAEGQWLSLFAYGAGCCWEVLRLAPEGKVHLDRAHLVADLRTARDRLLELKETNRLFPPMAKKLQFIEGMLTAAENQPTTPAPKF